MWKLVFRIVFWGGVIIMVAPDTVGVAIKGLGKGFGLILEGATESVVHSTTESMQNFVEEGWKHPTQGAIGWKLIDALKNLFH